MNADIYFSSSDAYMHVTFLTCMLHALSIMPWLKIKKLSIRVNCGPKVILNAVRA